MSGVLTLLSAGVSASVRTTFFGNCEANGSTPSGWNGSDYDFAGAQTFYSNSGSQDFFCPGSGPQAINSLGCFVRSRGGTANVRMALYRYKSTSPDGHTIYDSTLELVCQWDALIGVTSLTGAWVEKTAANLTGTTTIVGGNYYKIAVTMDSGLLSYAYTTGVNETFQIGTGYTGGFPDPLSAGSGVSTNMLVRVSVTGNGTAAIIPAFEDWYIDTDYGGGGSNGSPSKPYTGVQTFLSTRCNLVSAFATRGKRAWIVGAANDTTAISTFSFGQMAPTSSRPLYLIGNATGPTWDTGKYKLSPSDRTTYYGSLNITVDYVYMIGLQIDLPSTTVGQTNEVVYLTSTVPGSISLSNSIIRAPGGTEYTRYLSSSNSLGGIDIWNVLMYGMGVSTPGEGIKNHGLTNVYNCTILGGDRGIDNTFNVSGYSTINIKNSYVRGTTAISGAVGSTQNLTTVATSDATGSVGLQNIAANTGTFVNVGTGTENLSLANGSPLITAGTSNSGDPAPLNFTTDMTGATLSSPPDIGAIKK